MEHMGMELLLGDWGLSALNVLLSLCKSLITVQSYVNLEFPLLVAIHCTVLASKCSGSARSMVSDEWFDY